MTDLTDQWPPDGTASSEPERSHGEQSALKRRLWLLLLFDALEHAGLAPAATRTIHSFTYFADALSPVYELPVLDGELLKREGGPFYPDVQWDVDRLAIQRLLTISNIQWRLAGDVTVFTADYGLSDAGASAVGTLLTRPSERAQREFLGDLAIAFARAAEADVDRSTRYDANYGNLAASPGELIQFAPLAGDMDVQHRNLTQEAAESFNSRVHVGSPLSDAEKLHLYVDVLRRAANGGG